MGPRRIQTSTSRDLRERVATSAPVSAFEDEATPTAPVRRVGDPAAPTVELVDDVTGPVPMVLDEVPAWARQESAKRAALARILHVVQGELSTMREQVAVIGITERDVRIASEGATLARRLRRAVVTVALSLVAAAAPAAWTLVQARDAAARELGVAATERARLRLDLDQIRAEHAALFSMLLPARPAGGLP